MMSPLSARIWLSRTAFMAHLRRVGKGARNASCPRCSPTPNMVGTLALASARPSFAHPTRSAEDLLQRQRDKAHVALGIRNQQQRGLLAVLLELIDALLHVGWIGDLFVGHLHD